MKKKLTIFALAALAAVLLVACGSDEEPTGVPEVRYWDIAWSSPDTVLTDIQMLSDTSGWACGYRYNPATEKYDGLIYQYNGTTWTVNLFIPGSVDAKLLALDFTAAKSGWALGSGLKPFLLRYDGVGWMQVPVEGLMSTQIKLLDAVADNDVWLSDGRSAFHYDGAGWTQYMITDLGMVDDWEFPKSTVGWAVDYESGYCHRWDGATSSWVLEPVPLYNATSFYFSGDGSGMYADYVDIPPVTERADIFVRAPGPNPAYERVYASGRRRYLSACAFFPPDYYFFAGPNAAFEVTAGKVRTLNYVPAGELGLVRRISVAAEGDVWGIVVAGMDEGPSFIIHKKG